MKAGGLAMLVLGPVIGALLVVDPKGFAEATALWLMFPALILAGSSFFTTAASEAGANLAAALEAIALVALAIFAAARLWHGTANAMALWYVIAVGLAFALPALVIVGRVMLGAARRR